MFVLTLKFKLDLFSFLSSETLVMLGTTFLTVSQMKTSVWIALEILPVAWGVWRMCQVLKLQVLGNTPAVLT